MKYLRLVIATLFALPGSILFAHMPLELNSNRNVHACFSAAMIGYDNVINARVGVPYDHAIATVSVNLESPIVENVYKFQLHNIVAGAFVWEYSPHEYAVKTLFDCATSMQTQQQSVALSTD